MYIQGGLSPLKYEFAKVWVLSSSLIYHGPKPLVNSQGPLDSWGDSLHTHGLPYAVKVRCLLFKRLMQLSGNGISYRPCFAVSAHSSCMWIDHTGIDILRAWYECTVGSSTVITTFWPRSTIPVKLPIGWSHPAQVQAHVEEFEDASQLLSIWEVDGVDEDDEAAGCVVPAVFSF